MRLEMHLQPDFLKMTFIDSKKKKKKYNTEMIDNVF